MPLILQMLVNDPTGTTYTTDILTRCLVVAAFQVKQDADFSAAYVTDIVGLTITPDPVDMDQPDESFVNLVCLKAACILNRGAAVVAANRAIAVRDGSSSIDLRSVVLSQLKLLEKGWCAVYDDQLFRYQSDQFNGFAGAAVMTPFRTVLTGGGLGMYASVPGRDRNSYGSF